MGDATKVFQSNCRGVFVDDCSWYLASRMVGKLKGRMLVIFDLKMMLMGMKVFLVGMIALYQKKYLLVHLLYSVHLEYMSVVSNMVVVRWCLGG